MDVQAVVFDYGAVLSTEQPPEDVARIERLAGVGPDGAAAFWNAYWHHRPPYDAGRLPAAGYWAAVGGDAGLAIGGDAMGLLAEADAASWAHLNPVMVAWLEAVADAGLPVGLLSNAPFEVRDRVLAFPWTRRLAAATFSCDVGVNKPDPAVYRHCLDALGVDAASTLFLDDRLPNVEAARRAGLRALHFTDAAALARDLGAMVAFADLPVVGAHGDATG